MGMNANKHTNMHTLIDINYKTIYTNTMSEVYIRQTHNVLTHRSYR